MTVSRSPTWAWRVSLGSAGVGKAQQHRRTAGERASPWGLQTWLQDGHTEPPSAQHCSGPWKRPTSRWNSRTAERGHQHYEVTPDMLSPFPSQGRTWCSMQKGGSVQVRPGASVWAAPQGCPARRTCWLRRLRRCPLSLFPQSISLAADTSHVWT